jgi:hypothetical protein
MANLKDKLGFNQSKIQKIEKPDILKIDME